MRIVSWPLRLLGFLAWFSWHMCASTARMVGLIVRPHLACRGIIAEVSSGCRTRAEIAMLSVLISLTPGTLVVATRREEDGRWTLFVNDLFARDAGATRTQTADLEARMMVALHPTRTRRTP